MLSQLLTRLRALVRREATDADLDEEIRYHLEREIDRNVANGMSATDARDAARRAFGNVSVATEQARDASRWTALEEFRQDVVYAMRTFRRAPTFVVTVVATIGLGLGLLSSAFTFFNAYVLRPLAVRDPHSLYELHWSSTDGNSHRFSWNQFQGLSAAKSVFSEAHAYSRLAPRLRGQSAGAQLVSGNYFDMLGIPPALGRTLVPSDGERAGANAVMVLSHETWLTTFGGDSAIVGKKAKVNGVSLEIVGVARRGFGGLTDTPYNFWMPITMVSVLGPTPALFQRRDSEGVGIVGRLASGVTEARASAWVRDWLRAETADRPEAERMQSVWLISRATSIPPSQQWIAIFGPVVAAFLLVMLIPCANVANIMLARGMARQREIGIRLALGAGRARIIRQLLAEAMLLAIPAGVAGLLLSRVTLWAAVKVLYATIPPDAAGFVRLVPLDADVRVVAFVTCAVLLAAIGFGLVPAIQASRPNIVHASRGDFDTPFRPSRLRNALVVAQISMSVLLLISAGLLLSATRHADRVDPGIRTHNIAQIELLPRFRGRALNTLREDAAVRSIASASSTVIDGCCRKVSLRPQNGPSERVGYIAVSDNWFSVLDLPIVRGRAFTPDEARSRGPVVIVSQSAASRLWPGRDPLGEMLSIPSTELEYRTLEPYRSARVIGVARDAALGWIGLGRDVPTVYFPQPLDSSAARLVVLVSGDASQGKAALERALARLDSAAIAEMHTLDDVVGLQVYPFRAMYWVASALGIIALTLTLIGVYGVVSYLVAQRRREFGIRLALGAAKRSLVALVLRDALRLAAVGLTFGVVLALGVSRVFASFIPGLDTYDPFGYVVGVALVLTACFIAAFGPSRRAGAIDPVEALRADS